MESNKAASTGARGMLGRAWAIGSGKMGIGRLVAVAVVVGGLVGSAGGQRSGGGHGGGGGGSHGGGGGGFHAGGGGGFRGGGGGGGVRVGQAGGARPAGGYRVAGAGRPGGAYRGVGERGPGGGGGRPAFYERGRGYGDRGERRDRRAYGFSGITNYGWLDAGDLGFADDGYPADGGYYAGGPDDASGEAPENYVEQPYAQGGAEPEDGGAAAESAPVQQQVSPRLSQPDAVTLVFKDGRPVQTIHNYALTRTTLYVTDRRRREIAVADLDLAATEKENRAAGVEFQLPQTQ